MLANASAKKVLVLAKTVKNMVKKLLATCTKMEIAIAMKGPATVTAVPFTAKHYFLECSAIRLSSES